MGAESSSPVPAAEAALLHARAAAETTRAAADAAGAYALAAATALPLVVCALLAVDFYVHESPAHIQRRMLAALRARRAPPGLGVARAASALHPLRAAQPPLRPSFQPTMLLGPTGCGKSTALAELARSLATAPARAAVVLVRLRLPLGARAEGAAGASASPAAAAALMDAAAAQVFAQIGFPLRRSLVSTVLARGLTLRGEAQQAEVGLSASGRRLVTALELLFAAAAQAQAERVAAGECRIAMGGRHDHASGL
jgi:hypothetical protein